MQLLIDSAPNLASNGSVAWVDIPIVFFPDPWFAFIVLIVVFLVLTAIASKDCFCSTMLRSYLLSFFSEEPSWTRSSLFGYICTFRVTAVSLIGIVLNYLVRALLTAL